MAILPYLYSIYIIDSRFLELRLKNYLSRTTLGNSKIIQKASRPYTELVVVNSYVHLKQENNSPKTHNKTNKPIKDIQK